MVKELDETLSIKTTFALGALGGLLPIVASLISIDLAPIIDHASALTPGNYIGYTIRVLALVILGGTMAALNSEVKNPLALVQIGIAAPALLTAFINGGAAAATGPRTAHATLSFVSIAKAGELQEGQLQLAGGLFDDILRGITRPLADVSRKLNSPPPSPPVPPQIIVPPQLGNFCATSSGLFPVSLRPIGNPCTASSPQGSLSGVVVLGPSKPIDAPMTPKQHEEGTTAEDVETITRGQGTPKDEGALPKNDP
jgi:hypothetical protein